jgi:hypothetical protein
MMMYLLPHPYQRPQKTRDSYKLSSSSGIMVYIHPNSIAIPINNIIIATIK